MVVVETTTLVTAVLIGITTVIVQCRKEKRSREKLRAMRTKRR